MAIVKFTRMERDVGVLRRYGDFTFLAQKRGGMLIHGQYTARAQMHGDNEMIVLAEETELCAQESGLTEGAAAGLALTPWIKRGAGVHPKAGPFVAYKAPGLIVKITGKGTTIEAHRCQVPGARAAASLAAAFRAMVGDRDAVRVSAGQMRRSGQLQEEM